MPRSREQVIRDFVQAWLAKAESDMHVAEHVLDFEQEDYFVAAFHAQQAAEKFLKAFLVRHQIPFPKTHDIERLLGLAGQVDPSIASELAPAWMLTPFGVEFRYPSEETADLELARQAVQEAERVKAAILQRLAGYLGQGGRLTQAHNGCTAAPPSARHDETA